MVCLQQTNRSLGLCPCACSSYCLLQCLCLPFGVILYPLQDKGSWCCFYGERPCKVPVLSFFKYLPQAFLITVKEQPICTTSQLDYLHLLQALTPLVPCLKACHQQTGYLQMMQTS